MMTNLNAPDQDYDSGLFPRGTETILVAEDSRSVREILRIVLTEAGYRVHLASDGAEAIEIFGRIGNEVDMALLDVVMPKKNGKDVYEFIRERRPGTKVLFMSGYTQDIIGKSGILEEGLELIMKPLDPQTLLARIRKLLDKKTA